MTYQVWRFVMLLAAVAIGIGIYLGFSSITVPALNGTQDCGHAFGSADYYGAGVAIIAECDSKRHDHKQDALIFIVAGGVIGFYAFLQSGGKVSPPIFVLDAVNEPDTEREG